MTIKNWWENLLDRERQVLVVGGILCGVLVVYAALWSPLSSAVQDRKMEVIAQRQLLHYLQKTSATIRQLKAEGIHVNASDTVNLLSLTEQSLSQQALSVYLKQVQQPEKNQVALTFEKIPFDKLMQWLQVLETSQGIRVSQMTATRLSIIGTANVTLVLSL